MTSLRAAATTQRPKTVGLLGRDDSGMIRARLLPPRLKPEITTETSRALIKEGRAALAFMQRISRSRALSYVRWAKSRGFEAGYRAGLSKAESDLLRVIDQLRTTYNTAADIAHRDLEQLHFRLAEHLIDTASLGEPRTLACWIERAISVLKRNRPLRLLFNPRYEKIIEHISPQLPSTLHVAPSLDLKKVDFRLESDIGGVEFSWQAALEARRNEQPEPSDT